MPKPYPKEFRDDVVRVARSRELGQPGAHIRHDVVERVDRGARRPVRGPRRERIAQAVDLRHRGEEPDEVVGPVRAVERLQVLPELGTVGGEGAGLIARSGAHAPDEVEQRRHPDRLGLREPGERSPQRPVARSRSLGQVQRLGELNGFGQRPASFGHARTVGRGSGPGPTRLR